MTAKPLLPTFARPLDSTVNINNFQKVAETASSQAGPSFGSLPNTNFTAALAEKAQIRDFEQFARTSETYVSQVRNPETILRNMEGRPNPLNQYANYTYHVRFSLIDVNQAYSVTSSTNLSKLNQIIIAESGATAAFNISKFSFVNTVSPSFRNRNQNLMTWKMTITEPFGLTMPDYIFAAANNLNVRNANRFPFFIELWFNGYNEDGTIAADNLCYKIWRVMMIDMNLAASHTGTSYDLEGVADNGIGSSNQYSMTPATVKVDGVKTLGEAIQRLEDEMNKAAKKAENTRVGTTYKVVLPNEMKGWEIVPANSQTNSNRNGSMAGENSGKSGNEVPINRGQDIGNFVNFMIAKCGDQADRWLRGVTGASSTPSFEKNGLGNIIQIFSEVELGQYNEMLNDYDKKITFRIVPYTTTRIVSDPEQAKKMQNINIQVAKIGYLKETNQLSKRYDYIYTGKNTEVIKFDIKVDNFWSISLPAYLGTRSYAQVSHGPVAATNSAGFRENLGYGQAYKLAESVQARVKELDNLLKGVTGNSGIQNLLSKATNGTDGLNAALSNLRNLPTNLENLTSNQVTNLVSSLGGSSNVLNSLKQAAAAQLNSLATLNSKPIPQFDYGSTNTLNTLAGSIANLLSEINRASLAVQSLRSDQFRGGQYLEDIKTKVESDDELKVAFLVDNQPKGQDGISNGSEPRQNTSAISPGGALPPGASLFGQVLNNLYERNQMVEIEMTIRGDPWWIGMTNLEENEFTRRIEQNGNAVRSNNTETANYLIGENVFLLSFKTGSNYDENTGFMKFNTDADYFNGIYAVLEVTNHFENGSFTQDIKAFKELFAQRVSKQMTPKVTPDAQAAPQGNSNYDPTSGALVPEGSNIGPIIAA